MTALKSDRERTHLGTMTERQAATLVKYRQKISQLRVMLKDAEGQYRDMISMSMPAGANVFDDNTFSFYYEEKAVPNAAPPEDVKPEDVED